MNPTTEGPTKPPRFPTELIKAKPAATAEPERNSLGMAQKGARKPQRPISTKDKSASANKGERVVPMSARAKTAATRLGIMTSSPTVVLEYPLDRDLMICGVQKLIVYLPIISPE